MAEVVRGFAMPEEDLDWVRRVVDSLTPLTPSQTVLFDEASTDPPADVSSFLKSSLRLDQRPDATKRDVQLSSALSQSSQNNYFLETLYKMEIIKAQIEYNALSGDGARERKFNHRLAVYKAVYPAFFEDVPEDQHRGLVQAEGVHFTHFQDWEAERSKVYTARGRLLTLWRVLGSAVLVHPFFSQTNWIKRSKNIRAVLSGLEEEGRVQAQRPLRTVLRLKENEQRAVLEEVLLALAGDKAAELVTRYIEDFYTKHAPATSP
uniref:Uncharacterized protein n=1 Tax=Mycena chlorophos TaxID=658473 RepID=A0ABQ0KWX6_MYCCL|nr:predicted protein [Mycena chlorophos]